MEKEEIFPGYFRFAPPRKTDASVSDSVADAFKAAFRDVRIKNTGSGAVAVGSDAVAAGKQGIAIKGNVQGQVTVKAGG